MHDKFMWFFVIGFEFLGLVAGGAFSGYFFGRWMGFQRGLGEALGTLIGFIIASFVTARILILMRKRNKIN